MVVLCPGPSILAAFGSIVSEDIHELRILLKQMLSASPVNLENMGMSIDKHIGNGHSDYSGSCISGGDSVYSTPTFARPRGGLGAGSVSSSHSAKSYQGSHH